MSDLIFEIPFDLDVSQANTLYIFVERETRQNLFALRSCSRFFRFFLLLLTVVGHIVFLIAVVVTLCKLKVLQLFKNLVLAFDQGFKLFILSPDLVLQRDDHFICLLFDRLLKLSKLAVESFKVALEFLQDNSCFLRDNTID